MKFIEWFDHDVIHVNTIKDQNKYYYESQG